MSSDIEACTREVQSLEFKIRSNNYFSIADFPGLGESVSRDTEYIALYKRMLSRSDVVMYILRADARDFSVDEIAMSYLFDNESKKEIVFSLNFCDKIEPLSRTASSSPTKDQLINIDKKINDIQNIFNPYNDVVPYSAGLSWNLDKVSAAIADVILKSDFVR